MKKRVLAAMMACAMAAGLLSGCSSEPKNPGDSNEPVTTAAAGQTEAGDAMAAAQEESGPKIFHDYMTTDVDTINPHIYTMSVSGDVIARTSLQLYRQYPNAEGTRCSIIRPTSTRFITFLITIFLSFSLCIDSARTIKGTA